MQLEQTINSNECESLWVFGYGSLCWRPGFTFDKAVTGHVKGFLRKFWQGNNAHRGTREKPGRVATLVEATDDSTVYGVAFAISGEAAIHYLSQRECKLGGYDTRFATFFPTQGEPIRNVLMYIATPTNSQWLGDAALSVIADEITETKGQCGHNVEYILRLANFMRLHFPNVDDSHLYNLEYEIIKKIHAKSMSLVSLMGDGEECIAFGKTLSIPNDSVIRRNEIRVNTFQFTAALPAKTLRCLNI